MFFGLVGEDADCAGALNVKSLFVFGGRGGFALARWLGDD